MAQQKIEKGISEETPAERKFKKDKLNSLLLGYGVSENITHLTNSQGKYLLNFRSLESIRNRFDSMENSEGKNYVQKLSEIEKPAISNAEQQKAN